MKPLIVENDLSVSGCIEIWLIPNVEGTLKYLII